MKQLNLFKTKVTREFGGSLMKNRRKAIRPLTVKKPIHFVLKANSSMLLLRRQKEIRQLTERMNRRFGVKQYSLAIHADHIHMVVRIHSRELYRRWIRALTSLLVRQIAGLKFSLRPYSVILSWGRQFKTALGYLNFNQQEGDVMLYGFERLEHWRSNFITIK